jgi:hypothetical protein
MKKPTSVKALLSLVLLAAASMFSCKGGAPTSSTTPQPQPVAAHFSVEGTVFCSTTPISDVIVTVTMFEIRYGDSAILTTETTAGYYRFASVKEGLYWIKASAPGYVENLEAVQFKVDGNIKRDLYLSKKIDAVDPPDNGTVSTSRPTLVWSKIDEADSYSIEINENSGNSEKEKAKGIKDNFYKMLTELRDGDTIVWYVYAYNRQGTQVGSTYWGLIFKVRLGPK